MFMANSYSDLSSEEIRYFVSSNHDSTRMVEDSPPEIYRRRMDELLKQTQVPIYNPANSSSYNQLECKDIRCLHLEDSDCTKDYKCQYEMSYADTSFTRGVLSEETLQFTDGIDNVTMNNFVLGCSHNSTLHVDGEGIPGIIGLTMKPESLVTQLNYHKFAYCFGDYDDIDAHGYATFGDAAHITGSTTPIQPFDGTTNIHITS
ncbi:hypothetical protein IFM89_008611 [Coptis chinensis]|uniref:Xylanase inhibitor N-terminal domain-containing protein n=1 Tax=Coptis chinensis TaxID=261450 RepID=A0A835HIR0_9MAGN|nr:hypothetical protein IFM89_008611 [Coptis chinensis]